MRVFVVFLSVVAAAAAASITSDYLPPVADNSLPNQEYSQPESNEESVTLADDGYRYKVVRKLKQRLRRDVSEPKSSEYLPLVANDKEEISIGKPAFEATAIVKESPEEGAILSDDGYQYKTVRRVRYRHRRDVSELANAEYLPPTEENQAVVATTQTFEIAPEAETKLAEDGYRYKTVRRLKYRHRRDVSELPEKEYLPPTEVQQPISEEVSIGESVPEVKTELAEDGYRYKTVRRLKYRHRRDVSELPEKEYLPPTEVQQPVSEEVSIVESVPEVKTDLAEDGYRYKTVRRLKYRHRRDVSELPEKEYLPPTEVQQPVSEEVSVVEAEPEVKTELSEDGYHYKTIRRLKYRHRRDVNELPSNEYLTPKEEVQPTAADISIVEEVPEVKTQLAEDGYRYKTVRRLKYRHRRDVSELPQNEYLPPSEVEPNIPEDVSFVKSVPEEKTELAEDGYRYKTIRRLKYRHRRDVSELPENEYLPPSGVEPSIPEEVSIINSVPEEKTELAEDGYRYKTVRRLKYRHRRDVSELPENEYLPPTEIKSAISDNAVVVESLPELRTELADDGYRYKTVRRLKYKRH